MSLKSGDENGFACIHVAMYLGSLQVISDTKFSVKIITIIMKGSYEAHKKGPSNHTNKKDKQITSVNPEKLE